jgi:ABC-type dipeptide/oligopeptide/nickel transport system ATPase component
MELILRYSLFVGCAKAVSAKANMYLAHFSHPMFTEIYHHHPTLASEKKIWSNLSAVTLAIVFQEFVAALAWETQVGAQAGASLARKQDLDAVA